MQNYDSIVFDLDGTLWNASESCAQGWTSGLRSLEMQKTISATHIESVCGLTYPDCVRKLCPEVTENQFMQVMEVLNNFERLAVEEKGGTLYPGVTEGLHALKEKYSLYLVSNCQDWYLESFFKHSGLKELFSDWESYGRTGKPKVENLKDIALRNNLKKPVYIGDTESDMRAALGAGYDFIFVSYGFGSVECETKFSNFEALVHFFRK